MLKKLVTKTATISLPAFFPDATQAAVKGAVDSADLKNVSIQGVVVNTLHLSLNKPLFDIHKLMSWRGPIITDSGGFQVMSLIHNHPKNGTLTENEAIFFKGTKDELKFDAERSVQAQIALGADIVICLDDCTKPEGSCDKQKQSVARTISWAKRCRDEFDRLTKDSTSKPLIFAVVQGGNRKDLRKECANALLGIGFDGYCYGGWPVGQDGTFMSEIIAYTASLLPKDKPKYAMGVGKPKDIVECFKMGYNMFDCVIPTREARHKKLYVYNKDPRALDILNEEFYGSVYLQQSRLKQAEGPVSTVCDCLTCQNYSLGYLYHLFKVKDILALRLATIHNLRFYSMLMEALQRQNAVN